MQSSGYDRTLMSAGAFLAGFYPLNQSNSWNKDNITWQPIPIHSAPLEYDNVRKILQVLNQTSENGLILRTGAIFIDDSHV